MKFNIGDEVEVISETGGYTVTRIGSRGVVASVGVNRSLIKFSHISQADGLQYIGHSWEIENRDLKLLEKDGLEDHPHAAILRKIRAMHDRRKSLGYKF